MLIQFPKFKRCLLLARPVCLLQCTVKMVLYTCYHLITCLAEGVAVVSLAMPTKLRK